MIRISCGLILIGTLPLVQVMLEPTGPNASHFTFVGTPLLVVGIALYTLAHWRRAGDTR